MNWKNTESQIAKYLGGERVPITGRLGKPDVEHVKWAIEVKARTVMPKWIADMMEYLKREIYLYLEVYGKSYLCTSLQNLNTVDLASLPEAQTIQRKKIVGWLDYGLNQAFISKQDSDKIPVTILHQRYWKYTDSVCLVPCKGE